MILSKTRWNLGYEKDYKDSEVINILHKLNGIDDYQELKTLGFKDFNDPYLFEEMDKVIKKIKLSIRNNENILIYGDYDVDGITATSILYRALKDKGANVKYLVPNRFQDGYGLSLEVIEFLKDNNINLIITVDNGITSIEEVESITALGISVIVTDHHEPKETLPKTDYILHSFLNTSYPFKHLCGAGVAFKIAEALDKELAWKYVDLAMLGTIADMMPLVGENKAIVNEGLKRINNTNVLGLRILLDDQNIEIKRVKDISFNIAPKLNSLGRVGSALVAIDLLVSNDVDEINKCIQALLDADTLRKELTIQNTELAYKMIDPKDKINILYSPNFYEGVLGIIAQKVMKKTGKITGVFNVNQDNYARGSFRTFGEYNVLGMLEKNADLLDKFGGHDRACGVNMKASNIKELKERLSLLVEGDYSSVESLDVSLALNHTLINKEFVNELYQNDLEDTTFLFKDLDIIQTTLLADKHTKIKAKLKNGLYVPILIFNDSNLSFNLSNTDSLEVVGDLKVNVYNGIETIQIIAKDYRVNGIQVIDYRNRYDYNESSKHFSLENSLILKDEYDSLGDLELLLKEQSPSIIYLAPVNREKIELLKATDIKLLRSAYYLLSTKYESNSLVLLKDLGISKNVLDIILRIFEEVGLITLESSKIKLNKVEQKIQIEDSKTYQDLLNNKEVLDFLSGDIKEIKKYVLDALDKEI